MDNQKLLLYGGAAVLVLVMLSRRSSATVINQPSNAPDSKAFADFAARGLDSLSSVAKADVQSATTRYTTEAMTNAQLAMQQSRDAAYTAVGLANARAAQAAANASGKGKTGFSVGIPGLGDVGIHW